MMIILPGQPKASHVECHLLVQQPPLKVVHASGAVLKEYYDRAQIGMLLTEPIPYWEFAAPMKLYEYIAYGLPVIAAEGTLSGDFVSATGVGWVVPYRAEALAELLIALQEDPTTIERAAAVARDVRWKHTWLERARQVVDELSVHHDV